MNRPLAVAALCLFGSAAILAASCDANVSENCIAGPCFSLLGSGGAGGNSSTVSASASGGTGGSGTADTCPIPAPTRTGDIPCDVFQIMRLHCQGCHQNPQKNFAPFSLLNYADLQLPYAMFPDGSTKNLRYQQMFDQTRPGACPRMPLGGHLSDQDYATLTHWLVGCGQPAPLGMGCGCAEDGGNCICEAGTCPAADGP